MDVVVERELEFARMKHGEVDGINAADATAAEDEARRRFKEEEFPQHKAGACALKVEPAAPGKAYHRVAVVVTNVERSGVVWVPVPVTCAVDKAGDEAVSLLFEKLPTPT